MSPAIRVFSTCPQSRDVEPSHYWQRVQDAAQWSQAAQCEGMLVYADNGIVDAWMVAQLVAQCTDRLCPLVAVQPVYMHPYAAAKMVSTIAYLHSRRMYLNMVAGGFRNDLAALGDETEHDERYERAVEYAQIVKSLTSTAEPVTFEGQHYTIRNARLQPPVPADCLPTLVMSGSSPAGLAAAGAIGAIAVKYPQPAADEVTQEDGQSGMRIGIIARESADEAWRIALERFPEERAGQMSHRLAMQVSDSHWHRQLSDLDRPGGATEQTYWLGPFKNYKTFCPYLVGDHDRVSAELGRYIDLGFRTFILDIPAEEEDLHHMRTVFQLAGGELVS